MDEKKWEDQEKVVSGPSKFDLMVGLFTRKPIGFTLERSGQVAVVINQVQAEDGSAESWNIQGFVTGQDGREFRGYWQTRSYHGFMYLQQRPRVRVVAQ